MMTQAQRLARKIVWLAYQASVPMGLGELHYREDLTEEDMPVPDGRKLLSVDYLFGRMMKLRVRAGEDGTVEILCPDPPVLRYQSWAITYPTIKDLLDAAERALVTP